MAYLHEKDILHRDLACRNILVAGEKSKYICKVADFGLSRRSPELYHSKTQTLPFRWCAPEVVTFGETSKNSDVWSFGVVMWEIFSRGAIPYAGMRNFLDQVKKGYRLAPPPHTPLKIANLLQKCWMENRETRPSFLDICKILDETSPQDLLEQTTFAVNLPPTTSVQFSSPYILPLDNSIGVTEYENDSSKLRLQNEALLRQIDFLQKQLDMLQNKSKDI